MLSSYLSTRECICRTVFASSASASRGTKQRRQLHFQFASYHVCETVTLMCTSVAKRILIIKCTKFGQLILRKIIKILATRCHILRLKCTKFDFGWGSAPDPAGGAYSAPPDPLAGFKGPTSKGREDREGRGGREGERQGKGEEKRGEGKGRGYKGNGGRDGEREGGEEGEKGRGKRKGKGGEEGKGKVPPLSEILNTPLAVAMCLSVRTGSS